MLIEQGYDPVYGARPLKRAIQQHIENPLAMEILKGTLWKGSRIQADVQGDRMIFRPGEPS
jgi:ATP-dependent Clp protease ATP-binding subunit ClpB